MKLKVSLIIEILLIIVVIFTIMAGYTRDLNVLSSDNNLTLSNSTKYDYFIDELNNSITPVKESLGKAASKDESFWVRITNTVVAIPSSVLLVPDLAFSSLVFLNSVVVDIMANTFGVDPMIILIGNLFLTAMAIWAALEWLYNNKGGT